MTFNTLSLFGIVLAIGIVVDDAIVVVENVERYLAQGMSAKEAAHKTMDEVGGALIAIALVLCAVFIPAAFISGLQGSFYQQFAITIAGATLISAFVSLTLSPAMAAILLKPHQAHETRSGLIHRIMLPVRWFFSEFNWAFDQAQRQLWPLDGAADQNGRRPAHRLWRPDLSDLRSAGQDTDRPHPAA